MRTKKGKLKTGYFCVIILLVGVICMGSVNINFVERSEKTVYSFNEVLRDAEEYLEMRPSCMINMIRNNSQIICNNKATSTEKGQHRLVLSLFQLGGLSYHHFLYQSEEGKEDGQLFLCRARIVDYIHLKDSGE